MPSATTTKTTMNGTKRKGAPVKDVHTKHNKKPKTESGLKSALKKEKVEAVAVKKIQELSINPDESESDGGVPIKSIKSKASKDSDATDDSDEEEIPKEADGVHPERAKAAAVNSKISANLRQHI
jgi:pumilio homology domain family member 6